MSSLLKLFLFSFALFQFSNATIDPNDQAVLVGWYNSLTSKGSLDWNTATDLCGQDGVSCNGGDPQTVGTLTLTGKGLKGSFPINFIGLTKLSYLVLNQNEFSGPIPKEVGLFESLYEIDVGTNAFTGTIPTQFANVTTLKKLTLYNNQLTGTIPTEFTDITYLALGTNQLTGTFPTQLANIFNITNNAALSLRNNHFSGTIPSFISDVSANILSFQYNDWDCPIPTYTASLLHDYFDTKADCDASCPANRCQAGETCSMRREGGYYCCPTGTSCASAPIPSCATIANENNIVWKGVLADGQFTFGECVSGYSMDSSTFIQRPCIQTGSTATWGPTHGSGVCLPAPGSSSTPTPTKSSANSVKIGFQLIVALSFLVLLLVA